MSHTLEREEVERRLGTTVRAKAAQVVVERGGFDEERTPLTEMEIVAARRPRRALVAVATAVAVAAAASGVVIVTRPNAGSDGVVTETSIPAALVAPASVPPGQQLWALTSNTTHHQGFVRQLFGDEAPDGSVSSGLLVDFKHAAKVRPGFPDDRLQAGTPVVVRGQHGVSRAVLDADIRTTEIEWIDGNTDLTVTVHGMALDAAVLVLDALRPRGANLMDGFDAADGSRSFRLLGQDLGVAPAAGIDASLEYSAAAPAQTSPPEYAVRTSSSAGLAGYLRVWLLGHRATDGTTVDDEVDWGVTVVWPDGRQVTVQTYPVHRDPALLERIARSATALDDGAAAALAAEAQARVAALPVLGTATVPAGTIELHGTVAPVAVCLRVSGSAPACSNPFQGRAFAPTAPTYSVGPAYASALIDGHWYVFGASRFVMSFVHTTPLPTQRGTIDGVQFAVVAVPAGIDTVTFEETTNLKTGLQGDLTRPTS